MEGSGVATITGRTLTVGGHQIEKICTATQHHARRSTASARAISITLGADTSEPAHGRERIAQQGSRTSAGVTSG